MKYLHLGRDTSIEVEKIVGVFDMDMTTVSKHTRAFLRLCEQENRVVNVSHDLPKSYILYDYDGEYSVYLSPLSPSTLLKRINDNEEESHTDISTYQPERI